MNRIGLGALRAAVFMALALSTFTEMVNAQPWTSYADNTRYLAIGDSLSAGYEAKPATQGFVYHYTRGAR